jgi:hypothetical protein
MMRLRVTCSPSLQSWRASTAAWCSQQTHPQVRCSYMLPAALMGLRQCTSSDVLSALTKEAASQCIRNINVTLAAGCKALCLCRVGPAVGGYACVLCLVCDVLPAPDAGACRHEQCGCIT